MQTGENLEVLTIPQSNQEDKRPNTLSPDLWQKYQAVYAQAEHELQNAVFSREMWTQSELDSLGIVLSCWKFANAQEEGSKNPNQVDPAYNKFWDSKKDLIHQRLKKILRQPKLVEELLGNSNFKEKYLLTEFLAYQLWTEAINIEVQIPERTQLNQERYDALSEQQSPVIETGIFCALKDGNAQYLQQTLHYLLSSNEARIANQIFLEETLTPKELNDYAVQYINAFGYIQFIEVLSPLARDNTKIKQLFEEFSGQEVMEVMAELDEVYNKSLEDFLKHYESEVTKNEVNLVAKILKEELNIDLKDAKVLELAAGFGRVSKALLEADCGHVTSVEPQPALFEILSKLKETFKDRATAIQGRWDELTSLSIPDQDIGICLGRSLPHANSQEKLLVALSQMMGTVKTWLIDYPDPSYGVYADLASRLEKRLTEKGVTPQKAKMIYDSPNGKHFFHRMIVNKEQLEKLGQLIGCTVKEVKSEEVGQDLSVKNTYYLLEPDPNFSLANLCGDKLIGLTQELGLREPGVDFNLVLPQWGISLGQAIIYSFVPEEKRARFLNEVIKQNKEYGVPKVTAIYDETGGLDLQISRYGDRRNYE